MTHFGIGLRWRGHTPDGKQPSVQWYPLGAATEFQLFPDLSTCRSRILGGRGHKTVSATAAQPLNLQQLYMAKARVESTPNGGARYSVKLWAAWRKEPSGWAVQSEKGPGDVESGSLLLVAHNSDVTFGRVRINPL